MRRDESACHSGWRRGQEPAMDLGKIISEFPTQLLYAALIALIFSGTGRVWSQVTHRKVSATAGMEMGQVMGGLPAPQPAPHSAPYPVAYPVAYLAAHR